MEPNRNDDLSGLARDILRELKATGDLVLDAARLGKNELLHYVSESMHSRQPETPAPESQPRRSAPGPVQRKAKPRRVSYGRWALFCVGLPFLAAALICFLTMLGALYSGNDSLGFVLMLTTLGLCVPGGILMGLSRKKSRAERRYERYQRVVGGRAYMPIADIAKTVRRRESRVIEELEDMVSRGYFGPEARVHLGEGLLIVDVDAALEAEAKRVRTEEEERVRAAAAAAAKEKAPADAYEALLQELRTLNERIEDEAMSQRIYRIEAVARATFLAVKQKPEKLPQIRRFMDYYLPTTIKLLDAYAHFEDQDVDGDNIRSSRENIERMTDTLSVAFEKQFDSLFLAETMDINAEIRTMDSLLRQDGYIGGMEMPGK